jgi:hypothetical protein
MSTYVTDAKFSNIELSTTLTDLVYIDSVPLLKSLGNGQFKLNINSSRILGGTDLQGNQVFLKPSSFNRKTYSSSSVALYYGDLDGDSNVNAVDALRILRLIKSVDSLDLYESYKGVDRRFLAFPKSKPQTIDNTLPSMADVLEILKISAGLKQADIYTPIQITPTPNATAMATPNATPNATAMATPNATPLATALATPNATPLATALATPNAMPLATPNATPNATPLATALATPNATPLATALATPNAMPLATPNATPNATPLATALATPNATPLATAMATPNATPLATAMATPNTTPLATALATPNATPLATALATPNATPTPTPTIIVSVEPPGYDAYIKLEIEGNEATVSLKNSKPVSAYTLEFNQTFALTADANFVEFIPPFTVIYSPFWNFNNTTNTSGPFIVTGFVSADNSLPVSETYRPVLKLSNINSTFKFQTEVILKDELTDPINVYTSISLGSNRLLKISKKKTSRIVQGTFLGDVNRDGIVDIGDAAWIASYAAKLPDFPEINAIYGDVNQDNTVDIGDAAYIASYSAQLPGFDLPLLEQPTPTPTPTSTFTPTPTAFSGVIEIDENWKLVAFEGDTLETSTLDFVYQDILMARIIPHESDDINDKINPENLAFNETSMLSENGIWSIMYPSPDLARESNQLEVFKQLGVDSIEKQLKFLYNGYPQTLIMPMVNSESRHIQGGVDFGKLWKLLGESQQVIFYYREMDLKEDGTPDQYYPQVLIGTSGLRRYVSNAKEVQ